MLTCVSEAKYTYKRGRPIVPLMMQRKYDPDGWLGIIVGDEFYIDFAKYDFETAYVMLIEQLAPYIAPAKPGLDGEYIAPAKPSLDGEYIAPAKQGLDVEYIASAKQGLDVEYIASAKYGLDGEYIAPAKPSLDGEYNLPDKPGLEMFIHVRVSYNVTECLLLFILLQTLMAKRLFPQKPVQK